MTSFSDLEFQDVFVGIPDMQGVAAQKHFANGYGVSVIRHGGSYGGREGLYELGVLDREGRLCYDTPVTNDVVGHLSEDRVTEVMREVEALLAPPAPAEPGTFRSIKRMAGDVVRALNK